MSLIVGSGITIESGITISPSNKPLLGTQIPYTKETYFNFYTQQSGVTTSIVPDSGYYNTFYQLCYAWQSLTIGYGYSTVGSNVYRQETLTPTWGCSLIVSTDTDTLTSWPTTPAASAAGSFGGSNWGPAGVFIQNISGGQFQYISNTIPANKYFLVGIRGPQYSTVQNLAENRTAVVNGAPYMTVVNTVYWGASLPSMNYAPQQIGGTQTGVTIYDNAVGVMSVAMR